MEKIKKLGTKGFNLFESLHKSRPQLTVLGSPDVRHPLVILFLESDPI
jgi:hypothetical protein